MGKGKWKKSSIRKVLIMLFEHLWVIELTLLDVSSLILFQLFATGFNDTSDTCEKFATCVIDTGGAP